ncbi:MAG TPA: guanylate kinase [Bacteroidales bacterium]|jgi:guanylate kinase|nr:guanylate kinase [Bacteroidales bacterium]HOL98300.1 guanylate kinase [Bacteroidales bacterium]HOM36640.1 guanylate kinase [Bacteroidales bacterium]HPD24067.1 guanylate kinase [Bacteroidales bacterium]HRT00068.1 guanylate kinase [Bacteroidales bacterium]
MNPKVIIFSAPSGSGKTTIVKELLNNKSLNLSFSISACTRPPRENEVDGKDYYFLTVEEFKKKISEGEFLEWEEVYPGSFYGSLKSEVERLTKLGKNVLFDVDVRGGLNIKKYYGDNALAIFIKAPSIEELQRRLVNRSMDSKDVIKTRIEKAKYELEFADKFDKIIINDNLSTAIKEAENAVKEFIRKQII